MGIVFIRRDAEPELKYRITNLSATFFGGSKLSRSCLLLVWYPTESRLVMIKLPESVSCVASSGDSPTESSVSSSK